MPHAKPTTLTGAAGEYLVVSELLKRGFIATLVPDGVPNSDVVVTNIDGSQLAAIQVKTRWNIGRDGGWHMRKKHESIVGERLFYCFVDFGSEPADQPSIYVIPSQVVADILRRDHAAWLASPAKKGQFRNDGEMRRMKPDFSGNLPDDPEFHSGWMTKYKDAWNILRLDSLDLPPDD
jgi:hypothetical protein